jgi:archaellum component FlaC
MKETCKPIEELKEVLKGFMEIQIGINDAVNDDFEDLTKELTALDEQTAEIITRIFERIIIIETKISDIKTENDNIKRTFKTFDIKVGKKINFDINNIYHNLKGVRRRANENNEKVFDEIHKIYEHMERLENRINDIDKRITTIWRR